MQHKVSIAVGVSMLAVAGIVVTQYAYDGSELINLKGELGMSSTSEEIKFCEDEGDDVPDDINEGICGGLCPSGLKCGISAGKCKCMTESSSSSSWCTKPNEEKCGTSCCNKNDHQSCGTDAQGNPACVFCAGPNDDLCSPNQDTCCDTTTQKCVWDGDGKASCAPKSKSSSYSSRKSCIDSANETPACGGPCPGINQACIGDGIAGCTCVTRISSRSSSPSSRSSSSSSSSSSVSSRPCGQMSPNACTGGGCVRPGDSCKSITEIVNRKPVTRCRCGQ